MLQQKQLNPDGSISPSPFLNPTLLSEVGQARFSTSNGISNYNALQIIFQQRLKYGLQAQLNYTFSKCLSDTPGFFGQFGDNVATEAQTIAGWAFPQDPYNQIGDYGRCPQNNKHLFNGYVVYEMPLRARSTVWQRCKRLRKRCSRRVAGEFELRLPHRLCPDHFCKQRHIGHRWILNSRGLRSWRSCTSPNGVQSCKRRSQLLESRGRNHAGGWNFRQLPGGRIRRSQLQVCGPQRG